LFMCVCHILLINYYYYYYNLAVNPLTPTVAVWVQL